MSPEIAQSGPAVIADACPMGAQDRTSSRKPDRKLEVQIALGPPLIATRGFAAPEVETAHARAEHLARRYGHRRHLASALRGLCYVHRVRGHVLRTNELGSELGRAQCPSVQSIPSGRAPIGARALGDQQCKDCA